MAIAASSLGGMLAGAAEKALRMVPYDGELTASSDKNVDPQKNDTSRKNWQNQAMQRSGNGVPVFYQHQDHWRHSLPLIVSVLQNTMTDDITLCLHADGTVESFPASDVVIDRLLEIGLGTTSENGVAVVIAKTNGQELVVVIAGDRWCLDWFPLDYHEQGCVGSFHTVAGNQDATDTS